MDTERGQTSKELTKEIKTSLRQLYGVSKTDKRRMPADERRVFEPQVLWARHHEILNLHALGLKSVEIAERLGITEVSVSQCINSRLGQEKLAILREARDEKAYDVIKEMALLVKPAVEAIGDLLKESTPPGVRLGAAKTALIDLAGYGAPSKTETSVKVFSCNEAVDSAMARGLEMARKQGLIVEAEIVEVNEGGRPD